MGDTIVFLVIAGLCGCVFGGIGITAFRLKNPIHFWSGTAVKSEEITNVKAYNRANGWMWLVYGSLYILAALVGLYKVAYGGIILGISAVPGMFVLMSIYVSIEKKYRIQKVETVEEKVRRQMKNYK
ncbi:MAG: hypothetical protein RR448_07615 [Niameybacter sp.]|uniref:hypothetical protein n=1 Tax=Niameybacter sp. TaxID=2033640 RepID=UPI002FCA1998